MPKVKLLGELTYNGAIVKPGETLELGELSAKAAVLEGRAVYEESTEPEEKVQPSVDPVAANDAAKDQLKKAIDGRYTKDQLEEIAKENGVEFAYDARKAEIIEAVIAAGIGTKIVKA
jgi:hypothetical protein